MTNTETPALFFSSAVLPAEAVRALNAAILAAFELQRVGDDGPLHDGLQAAIRAVGVPLFGEELLVAVSCEMGEGASSVWSALARLWAAGEITPSPAVRAQLLAWTS